MGTGVAAAEREWPQAATGVRDYIYKHWQGALSLFYSFWINSFILNFVLFSSIGFAEIGVRSPYVNAQAIASLGVILIVLGGFSIPLAIWQIVGIWRAAGNRILHRQRYVLSVAARIACLIVVVQMASVVHNMSQDVPLYVRAVEVALGTTMSGEVHVDVIDQGRGILVRGPLEIGVVQRFSEVADSAPNAGYVQLESDGGLQRVGVRLHQEIERRNMATYVGTGCYSACTDAFLGGNRRIVSINAELGFHNAEMVGGSTWVQRAYRETEGKVRMLMREEGVSDSFIQKALDTPFTDIWVPDLTTLSKAGVITHIREADGTHTPVFRKTQ